MHATDSKCFPKRISTIKVISVESNGIDTLAFDWGCLTPASMKGDTHHARSCVTFNGHLYCCKFMCKVTERKENEAKRVNVKTLHVFMHVPV